MANSQGFTLPFTGRLGKLTTGYRAGRYITQVIPDVKPTGSPTDEQVMQRDLFGKVAAFYRSLKFVIDVGFVSKRGGAFNYAVKKNWPQFYWGADFELGYNFPELIFSEGKLAPVSVRGVSVTTSQNREYLRIDFVDDYEEPKSPEDKICVIEHFVESNKVVFRFNEFYSRSSGFVFGYGTQGLVFKGEKVEVIIFLYNEKGEVSRSQYCGSFLYDW